MAQPTSSRDQALVANVAQQPPALLANPSAAAAFVLGDWSPHRGQTTKMDFDPDRIGVVLAHQRGKTPVVYDVIPDENGKTWDWVTSPAYQGRRIRFNGVPSVRFAGQVGADSPVTWRQGEAWPVKTIGLGKLIEGDSPVTETATGQRAVLGDAVVTMDGGCGITVTIPAGYTVTVRTRSRLDSPSSAGNSAPPE
ncbi:MAG: hypothetical protein ACRDN0_21915 [Trebonia sp.]